MPIPSRSRSEKNLKQDQPDRFQPSEEYISKCDRLVGDTFTKEARLEQSGDINALQRHRIFGHYSEIPAEEPHISHLLYFLEEDIRELVQREIAIRLRAHISMDSNETRELLNKKYWILERKWQHYYMCLRDGYQRHAFDLWRSHPKWYMHQLLTEDCASKNGCCARRCGCCSSREPSPMRKLGVGHCTLECHCCRKARGFEVPEEVKDMLKKEFRDTIYMLLKHRIFRVATWGLVGGCFENPD
ncbi:uncharacterized protein N7483_009809 [Penicillium malachiteum]|uniref:uncharacterized protein n=1 Tax=Penicillium malachiteum TaxID=1324776 RepID=UPI0025470595|nr:uncharacterized protein N7483_009809 [Penicillium malachiteum]KAJ5721875.1 hypothetical protein N7483_009809 [Penicillium malachiteum]